MGKAENERAMRRFMSEIWSRGDMDALDELIAPDFAFVLAFARTDTIEGFRQMVKRNREVFEGLTYVANDVVADDTKGACWWTMTSKHVGTWRNVPASHKDVSIEGVTFFWFTPEGQFQRAVVENDVLGLLRQIGGATLPYEAG
jgi:steroid delta-isomerase-like uncharacterized protein